MPYSWVYMQVQNLEEFWGPYEIPRIESGLVSFKASTIASVQSLWPDFINVQDDGWKELFC